MADRLKKLVEYDRSVANITNREGARVINSGIATCREAMQSALRLCNKFEIDRNSPLLHTSPKACVLKAISHEKKEKENDETTTADNSTIPIPRALKCMRDYDTVRIYNKSLRQRNNREINSNSNLSNILISVGIHSHTSFLIFRIHFVHNKKLCDN